MSYFFRSKRIKKSQEDPSTPSAPPPYYNLQASSMSKSEAKLLKSWEHEEAESSIKPVSAVIVEGYYTLGSQPPNKLKTIKRIANFIVSHNASRLPKHLREEAERLITIAILVSLNDGSKVKRGNNVVYNVRYLTASHINPLVFNKVLQDDSRLIENFSIVIRQTGLSTSNLPIHAPIEKMKIKF